MSNKITIEFRVGIDDIEKSIKTAEDNAWEHAKDASQSMDFDFGDDEFGVMYQELSKRYTHNVEHLQFFMMTAMLIVKSLQENGMMTLFVENKPLPVNDVKERIKHIASLILNSYMWLASGYELTWLSNDELPEQIKVSFKFDEKDIIDDEQGEITYE